MIDIHTHILPNVDDGAPNDAEALKMLRKLLNDGINKVVLTPHIFSSATKAKLETIEKELVRFKALVNKELPLMELFFGFEIRWRYNLEIDYERLAFKGFKKKYVLVEFSTRMAEPISEILYNLKAKGFSPILAHAERYSYLTLDELKTLKRDGIIIQVNASAVLGLEGKSYKRLTHKLIKMGLVDIIASDCHNYEFRPPNLKEALDSVEKIFTFKEIV